MLDSDPSAVVAEGRTPVRTVVLSIVLLLFVSASVGAEEVRRRTGRTTVLLVQVLEASTAHHEFRCGGLGPSPLPVRARVLGVEQGVWPHPTIELDGRLASISPRSVSSQARGFVFVSPWVTRVTRGADAWCDGVSLYREPHFSYDGWSASIAALAGARELSDAAPRSNEESAPRADGR